MVEGLRLGNIPHTCEIFEIAVLSPHNCIEFSGGRQDDAVSQRQFCFVSQNGGTDGQICIQIHDGSFHHQSHRLQGLFFAHLPENPFEDFEQADRWNDQMFRVLDGGSEKVRMGTVGQIFEPTRACRTSFQAPPFTAGWLTGKRRKTSAFRPEI